MVRYCCLVGLCLFLVSLLPAQAKISLERPDIDLGIIYSGQKKKGHVGLKNIGTQPLRIFGVQPSCGCTTIKRPKDVLNPNESDEVEIEFNSIGYRGRVEKEVFINSSDSLSPYLVVKLYADVREELSPTTPFNPLWLGNVPVGGTVTKTVAFRNVSGHPLNVVATGTSSPDVTIQTDKKAVAPSDSVLVTVSGRADKAFYHNETVWLDIDSKNQSRITMHVSFIGIAP